MRQTTSDGPVGGPMEQARYADDSLPPYVPWATRFHPPALGFATLNLQREMLESMAMTVHNLHFLDAGGLRRKAGRLFPVDSLGNLWEDEWFLETSDALRRRLRTSITGVA